MSKIWDNNYLYSSLGKYNERCSSTFQRSAYPFRTLSVTFSISSSAGSQREELRPRQRSWGRRLWDTQRRDRASGNPLFPSIYPQNQSLFYALTYTSDFMGDCSPTTSLGEGVNLQLQLIKIPGHDKSVSTYKLCWSFSSLPEQVRLATCDCLQPPNCERHEML